MKTIAILALTCIAFAIVRFVGTFPGLDTSPAGLYKTAAHCFVFLLFGLAIMASITGHRHRWYLWGMAGGLTLCEVVAFGLSLI